jgi:hypothetical protein
MLAQSFLPAADLGITEPQKEALMKTLVLLETGRLRHAKGVDNGWFPNRGTIFEGHFNMCQWNSAVPNCGTVACLGGTAELISGVKFDQGSLNYNSPLYQLFMPPIPDSVWSDITPAQAATALRSYLTTGDAKWHEAIT